MTMRGIARLGAGSVDGVGPDRTTCRHASIRTATPAANPIPGYDWTALSLAAMLSP